MTVKGVEVNMSPIAINNIHGTLNVPSASLVELQIRPRIGPSGIPSLALYPQHAGWGMGIITASSPFSMPR